jgi:hypothetical protein
MTQAPKEIYRAESNHQAHLLAGQLRELGIEALVVNDAVQIAGGELPLGWTSLSRVLVPEEQAETARVLALRFEDQWRQQRGPTAEEDEGSLSPPQAACDEDRWQDWPVCPQCGQRRQARCPICGTAGTDFPLADLDRAGGVSQVLLFCPTCDDHFRPEFYRRCHACGHDYRCGVLPAGERPPPAERLSLRQGVLLAAILAFLAGLIGYFAWIVR